MTIAGREWKENDTRQTQSLMTEIEGEVDPLGEMIKKEQDQDADQTAVNEVGVERIEEKLMTSQMMNLGMRKLGEGLGLGHALLTLIIRGSVESGPGLQEEDAPTDHLEGRVQTQTLLHSILKKKQSRLRKRSHASSHQAF